MMTKRDALPLVLLALALTSPAAAQEAVVVPGPEYRAGSLRSWLLGEDYRDLWLQPVSVPVLDLRSHAGGLTPLRRGGGRQTAALRLEGGDGREYTFRSVAKVPELARHPDLRGALLGRVIGDQASSIVPAAPVAAGALSAAADLLAPAPRLFVMPDDPALGPFRAEFAGMLGTLEEVADEHDGAPGFAGFSRIVATGTMLDHLEEDPGHAVDTDAYLRARLLDLLIGDWDRHEDQWRWAREEREAGVRWIPIARDRDYAFSDYDGVLLDLARLAVPNAVRFTARYGSLSGLLMNSMPLDRELLAWVDRPAFDRAAAELQRRLTDPVIAEAVAALPPEHTALRGAELREILRDRRDALPEAAASYYRLLSRLVEIRLSDEDETVEVRRHPDGSVEVISRTATGEGEPAAMRRRILDPGVTREVRIYLRGGDDRAKVSGGATRGILVRIIGGGGADLLEDESVVARPGRWTALHDDDDDDRLRGTRRTIVDRRRHAPPDREPRGLVRIVPPDAGSSVSWYPMLDYSTTRGVTLGATVSRTTYAFRRDPFARRWHATARYSPRWGSGGVEAGVVTQSANPAIGGSARVRASAIEATRFYGFGSEALIAGTDPVVRHRILAADGRLHSRLSQNVTVHAGPSARLSRPYLIPGSPLDLARPDGWEGWSALGGEAGVELRRDAGAPVPLEISATANTSAFRRLDDEGGTFGRARAMLDVTAPFGRAWAGVGAGGLLVLGRHPFDQAAYLGGRETLRGYPEGRFAGDSMVHGSVELGHEIGRIPLLMNWRTAVFGFADAGRVFLDGGRGSGWHAAPGVGLQLSAMELAFRLTYAHGPSGRVYVETLRGRSR